MSLITVKCSEGLTRDVGILQFARMGRVQVGDLNIAAGTARMRGQGHQTWDVVDPTVALGSCAQVWMELKTRGLGQSLEFPGLLQIFLSYTAIQRLQFRDDFINVDLNFNFIFLKILRNFVLGITV